MTSKTTNKFSSEVRARAVRMVLDHEGEHASRWAAVSSIAAKIGCTAQTLHEWVKKAERDSGVRAGVPTDVATKLKALERENRELRHGQRDPAQGERVFCPGGARPPVQAMIAFIDDHRQAHGVEPICRVLPIALSTYHAHVAKRVDPSRLSARDRTRDRCLKEGGGPARVLGGELPGLRGPQGLAAIAARGALPMWPAARLPA